MASNDTAPKLDPRSEQDIIDQTTALARHYTGTSAASEGLGRTLVQLFARMMTQVVTRLNRVPENNHLAFLGLLGAQPLPPRPARVPLTFQLVDGSNVEAVVPAGTPVAAAADEQLPQAVFTTEAELVLTRARLLAVVAHHPPTDSYVDATAIATGGAAPGAFVAFVGATSSVDDSTPPPLQLDRAIPHRLYVTHPLLNLRSGVASVTFELTLKTALALSSLPNVLRWDANVDGDAASLPLVPQAPLPPDKATDWKLSFALAALPARTTLAGQSAPWLRASWRPALHAGDPAPATIKKVIVVADVTQPPDAAFANTAIIDLSKDFLPFGDRPQLGESFYLSNPDVLRPGAEVKVTLELSAIALTPDTSPALTLSSAWETWDGSSWTPVLSLSSNSNAALTAGGEVTFRVDKIAPGLVNGVEGAWLRVRINARVARTEILTLQPPDPPRANQPFINYLPPSLKRLTLAAKHTGEIVAGSSQNGLELQPWASGQPPFVALAEPSSALYLGFDQPIVSRSTAIYFQVDPPTAGEVQAKDASTTTQAAAAPRINWEYASDDGAWKPLAAADETTTFTRSGLVRFLPPGDARAALVFGQRQYWIRGRLSDGTPELQRRLRRISVNTTWASHASTTVNEILGSSNGNGNQSFTLSQTPVLQGQRIEVREQAAPTGAELDALRLLEGADAVTMIPADDDKPQGAWVRWHEVADFYGSAPQDRHYVLDHAKGLLTFGNGKSGRVPAIGSQNLRAAHYRAGGGVTGNRSAGSITLLLTTIPYVQAVEQHEDATGGADAETLDRVKSRTSRLLRHHGRAVTAQDFEDLAFEASPTVARVSAITPTFIPSDQEDAPNPGGVLRPGEVLVIVVPSSDAPRPAPSPELLAQVRDYLRARCAPALSLQVTGAKYAEVTVDAAIVPSSLEATEVVLASARATVHRFLHPLTGGADGKGWAFGQQPHVSDIYLQLAKIPGIDHIASLTVTCTPALELDASDPKATDVKVQREKLTYLIHSANHHHIVLAPAAAGALR